LTKTTITQAIAAASFLGLVFVTPALAETDAHISGNGVGSDNRIRIDNNQNTSIRQANNTNISNDVSINNNTGRNSSNFNTGGDVAIRTGNAVGNVSIQNSAGLNVARVSGCNGCNNDLNANIHGNGAFSDNSIRASNDGSTRVNQVNNTDIDNNVSVRNNTGDNNASFNTGSRGYGGGDVRIDTGDARANVNIQNEAGKNVAEVGGQGGGDQNITIHGNGAFSNNRVNVNDGAEKFVRQDNNSDIDNNVNNRNNTGYNNAGGSGLYDNNYDKHNYDRDRMHDYGSSYDKDHFMKYPYNDGYKKDYADHYVPEVRYVNNDYDRSYGKFDGAYAKNNHDYDRNDYDHDRKFVYFPVHKMVYFVPTNDRCDYNNLWYNNYDCGKNYVKPVYYKADNFKLDHGNKYYTRPIVYAESPKYVDHNYKNNYDHNKKYFTSNDQCDTNKQAYKKDYKSFAKYDVYRHPFYGGNTGGDVLIRTGNARSNVNIGNLASANYAMY